MTELITFLLGTVFGWLVTWVLQNRLNDDMQEANDLLQRDLAAAQRVIAALEAELATTKVALPEPDVEADQAAEEPQDVGDRSIAVEAVTAEAVVDEAPVEEVAPLEEEAPSAADASEEEPVVEEPVVEETATDEYELVPGTEDIVPTNAGNEEISDLTKLRGIGPKFSETLQSAGIKNFSDLAMSTPEQLHEIVQPATWQKVDFEDWIAQANDRLYK